MTHISAVVTTKCRNAKLNYHRQKVRGKVRLIAIPNKEMKLVHARLTRRLRKVLQNKWFDSSYGALSRQSAIANADRHAKSRYFYQLDIKDAYPSTPTQWMLAYVLNLLDSSLGEIEEIQDFLDRYCVAYQKGVAIGLPVGAPASPALFDLYCMEMIDTKIKKIAPGCVYTRYFDDITVSSKQPIPARLRRRIRTIIREAGYEVHRNKTTSKDRSRGSVLVTGVVITRKGFLMPKPEFIERVVELVSTAPEELTRSHIPVLLGLLGHLLSFERESRRSLFSRGNCHPVVASLRKRLYQALAIARSLDAEQRQPQRIYSAFELDMIRSLAPMAKIIEPFVEKLEKHGNEYKSLCPYHNEKHASFTVNEEKGFFHCFGCGAHGDIFKFVMDFTNCSFPAAVSYVDQCTEQF